MCFLLINKFLVVPIIFSAELYKRPIYGLVYIGIFIGICFFFCVDFIPRFTSSFKDVYSDETKFTTNGRILSINSAFFINLSANLSMAFFRFCIDTYWGYFSSKFIRFWKWIKSFRTLVDGNLQKANSPDVMISPSGGIYYPLGFLSVRSVLPCLPSTSPTPSLYAGVAW